jgi:hypothetical protein
VTSLRKSKRGLSSEATVALILSAVGTAGVVVLYYLTPRFQPIELLLMLVIVGLAIAGYLQGIIRSVMTIILLYIAIGIAAILYRESAPYVNAILQVLTLLRDSVASIFGARPSTSSAVDYTLGAGITQDTLAVSFGLVTALIWGILEIISRASLKDTSLPRLGILDNVGGVLIHLIIGILVAAFLFNIIGYGKYRPTHDRALLRPQFNRVLYFCYTTQWFWFPRSPPPIYIYDLHPPR